MGARTIDGPASGVRVAVKPLLLLLLFAGFAASVHGADYGGHILMPVDADKRLEAAVADLADVLERMTGDTFETASHGDGPGIHLVRAASDHAPADAVATLSAHGNEPFVIRSADDEQLWIVANDDLGLSHGIYFYLDQLGVRFLMPSDHWTIIPRRDDITVTLDQLVAPEFKVHTFFGTGGFGPRTIIDPELSMRDRWQSWQRRNRFGGEYKSGGHTGEAFNRAHEQILKQHPEYLAEVDGKRGPWRLGGKFCPSNAEVVQLYVDWTIERLRKAKERDPDAWLVSAEPADSGGHCTCQACQQRFGPVDKSTFHSDQVFDVANVVARAVREPFPDAVVSMYGYAHHAMPPTIDLEPNMIVTVVPYAFQRTGMSPEQFIAAWGQKVSRINLYDYWAITDWANSEPVFDYLTTPATRLAFWHANNVEGVHVESTYSAGAMALGWYVATRVMWDLDTDVRQVAEEFYDLAFGPARTPMQRMLERWANGFSLNRIELSQSYADLDEAYRLTSSDDAVRARVEDYIQYLEYLRRRMEFLAVPKEDEAARIEAAKTHLTTMWRIYHSSMAHTYRESRLIHARAGLPDSMETYLNTRTVAREPDRDQSSWDTVTPVTSDVLRNWLAQGLADYPPVEYEPRTYSGKLVPLHPEIRPNGEWSKWASINGTTSLAFHAHQEMKQMTLRVRWSGLPDKQDHVKIAVTGPSGEAVAAELVPGDEATILEIRIATASAGVHEVKLSGMSRFDLAVPQGVPLVLTSFDTWRWGGKLADFCFYVPGNLERVAMLAPVHHLRRLVDGRGEEVEYAPFGDGLMLLDVPHGTGGSVWKLVGYVTPGRERVQALNIPQTFSLTPESMMVPADALSQGE